MLNAGKVTIAFRWGRNILSWAGFLSYQISPRLEHHKHQIFGSNFRKESVLFKNQNFVYFSRKRAKLIFEMNENRVKSIQPTKCKKTSIPELNFFEFKKHYPLKSGKMLSSILSCDEIGIIARNFSFNKSGMDFSLFLLDGQVELELRRQLVFRVQSVREVDSADSAVGMDLEEQVDKNVTSQLAVAFREQEARPARRGSISCHLFSGRAP